MVSVRPQTWFRFYNEVVDDPKVQKLPPIVFRTWVNFMCIASKHGGVLPEIEDIAYRLRVTPMRAGAMLDQLVYAGLFEWTDGIAHPHNWQGRQFQSDVSTERVKRFRNAKRNTPVTANETSATEQSRTDPPKPPSGAVRKPRQPDKAFDLFREAYQAHYQGTPYLPTDKQKKGDFVQLSTVRDGLGVANLEPPPDWGQACANYFATPQKTHTLADLCVNYATYRIARLDRYKTPVDDKPKAKTVHDYL